MHVMEIWSELTCSINVPEESHELRLPVLSLLPFMENVTVHNQIDSDYWMNSSKLEISNSVYPKLTPPDINGINLRLKH